MRAIAFDLDGTLYDHEAVLRAIDAPRQSPRFEAALLAAIEPDARLRALLCALRRRYPLALVSNGGSQRQRAKLARLGVDDCFDAVLISGEQRCAKPSRAMFLRAVEALGVAPREILVVGDDPARDIAPAQRLSMTAFWVGRGQAWPRRWRPDRVLDDVFDLWEAA